MELFNFAPSVSTIDVALGLCTSELCSEKCDECFHLVGRGTGGNFDGPAHDRSFLKEAGHKPVQREPALERFAMQPHGVVAHLAVVAEGLQVDHVVAGEDRFGEAVIVILHWPRTVGVVIPERPHVGGSMLWRESTAPMRPVRAIWAYPFP